MGDDHNAAGVGTQEVTQPDDRVGVEVVGRFIEQQRAGITEQDARQLDAAALSPDNVPRGWSSARSDSPRLEAMRAAADSAA